MFNSTRIKELEEKIAELDSKYSAIIDLDAEIRKREIDIQAKNIKIDELNKRIKAKEESLSTCEIYRIIAPDKSERNYKAHYYETSEHGTILKASVSGYSFGKTVAIVPRNYLIEVVDE